MTEPSPAVTASEVAKAWSQSNRLDLIEMLFERIQDDRLRDDAERLVEAVNSFENTIELAQERERRARDANNAR